MHSRLLYSCYCFIKVLKFANHFAIWDRSSSRVWVRLVWWLFHMWKQLSSWYVSYRLINTKVQVHILEHISFAAAPKHGPICSFRRKLASFCIFPAMTITSNKLVTHSCLGFFSSLEFPFTEARIWFATCVMIVFDCLLHACIRCSQASILCFFSGSTDHASGLTFGITMNLVFSGWGNFLAISSNLHSHSFFHGLFPISFWHLPPFSHWMQAL